MIRALYYKLSIKGTLLCWPYLVDSRASRITITFCEENADKGACCRMHAVFAEAGIARRKQKRRLPCAEHGSTASRGDIMPPFAALYLLAVPEGNTHEEFIVFSPNQCFSGELTCGFFLLRAVIWYSIESVRTIDTETVNVI